MKIFGIQTTRRILKDKTGAAMMMAIFTVTIVMIVASEIMYETNVELAVSSQAVNQVKAHYAAKAGVEISLLRLHIYRKVTSMDQQKMLGSMIDMIWNMPFMWPPQVSEDVSIADQDQIKTAVKASTMQGSYAAFIASEASKIDLNDLGSPIPLFAQNARKQLLQIFTSKLENDEDFDAKYRGYDFEALVNNIGDWVDEDAKSINGGEESALYSDLDARDLYPPNQPFKSFSELHIVAGMTDDLYDILLPHITIYGAMAVNVNYASKEVLKSIGPSFTDQVVDDIIKRRSDPISGLFKDDKDFESFVGSLGIPPEALVIPSNDPARPPEKIPLIFDYEFNFRIKSVGQSGKVSREITAIVYDFDRVAKHLKKFQPTPPPQATPPSGSPGGSVAPTPTPAPTQNQSPPPPPKERPNIVYWNEA